MTEILEKYNKTLQDNFFSKSTVDAYISDVKKFLEFLPEENLQLIPGEILNYKVHLKENYKVSTVRGTANISEILYAKLYFHLKKPKTCTLRNLAFC